MYKPLLSEWVDELEDLARKYNPSHFLLAYMDPTATNEVGENTNPPDGGKNGKKKEGWFKRNWKKTAAGLAIAALGIGAGAAMYLQGDWDKDELKACEILYKHYRND